MLTKLIYCITSVLFINALLVVGCDDSSTDPPMEEVSFINDVLPIFQQHECAACHGGEAGLFVTTVQGLLDGGENGPAIDPGNADNSLVIQKLSLNPPFGDRIPQGASAVPESRRI